MRFNVSIFATVDYSYPVLSSHISVAHVCAWVCACHRAAPCSQTI